jgi:hypothetical protein
VDVSSNYAETLPSSGTAGSGSTAVDFEFRLDGSMVEKGSSTSTLSNADLESASRFICYPAQEAQRAGGGTSTETVSGVGQYSVALGYQNIGTGLMSTAIGASNIATGAILVHGVYIPRWQHDQSRHLGQLDQHRNW